MEEIVAKFFTLTGYNTRVFLLNFSTFIEQYREPILNYYKGTLEEIPSIALEKLDDIYNESIKVHTLFLSHQSSFDSWDYWDLLDDVEQIITNLETIYNSDKWLRSSITNTKYESSPEVDLLLKQNQTLEGLIESVGSSDKENDWVNLAIRNQKEEEDYTVEGGVILKASFQNNASIVVTTVIDNLQGENILGKDIYQKFTFQDNDVLCLSPRDTINQAFKINLELRRGDNPEFFEDGIQNSLIAGSNLGSVLYPSLFRQLYQVFMGDDTFKVILIKDIQQIKDKISLTVQAQSRLDELITETIVL
jgi:hypothetical protein